MSKSHVKVGQAGQAIVLVAMVLVVLLAAVGLAIDGGGLLFLQRDVQNAVDGAVLSASYALCTEGGVAGAQAAGLASALKDGFSNDGVNNTVVVNSPPTSGVAAGVANYVEVQITAVKPSYFIQVVYRDPLNVTARAVGNCSPRSDTSWFKGALGLSYNCPFDWSGAGSAFNGGIQTNNQADFTGSNIELTGTIDAIGVNGDPVDHDQNLTMMDGNTPSLVTEPFTDPLSLDISAYAPGGEVANAVSIYQSWNTDYSAPNKAFLEGLYYVDGDFSASNPTISANGFTIVATGKIDVRSLDTDWFYYNEIMNVTESGVRYPGLIAFSTEGEGDSTNCPSGQSALQISGSSGTLLKGVIYNPNGSVKISGNGILFRGAMIGMFSNFASASGSFVFEPSLLPPRPPSVKTVE